jgi:phospholipase C
MKFIEQNWGLAPLTARDAHANSLSSAFDFTSGPRPPVLLRVGATSRLDAFPTARGLTQHQATMIYVLYGGAGVVTLVLLVFAGLSGRLAARRRSRAGRVHKVPEESVR